MTDLYLMEFENKGTKSVGLFYDDDKGLRQPLFENFKQVAFDTQEEAQAKLDAMTAERQREDSAIAFNFDEAKAFTESHKWKFATTYAKTAPQEYLVKKWLSDDDQKQFERLVQAINKDYVIGYFYGHENKYLILDDYYYWYMPCYPGNMAVDLINRTTTDNLEFRDGAYYYKGRKEEE